MYYVCDVGRPFGVLAGPFDTDAEATAAAGAIEIDQPQYRARTEIWNYPADEELTGIVLPTVASWPAPTASH